MYIPVLQSAFSPLEIAGSSSFSPRKNDYIVDLPLRKVGYIVVFPFLSQDYHHGIHTLKTITSPVLHSGHVYGGPFVAIVCNISDDIDYSKFRVKCIYELIV